jgi:hypothetical protein
MNIPRNQLSHSHAHLTRRGLITGGLGFTAAALLHNAKAGAEDASPVMAKLSAYMSEARGRAIPAKVVEETKYHVLDTLAAMISGSELPPGRQALQFARAYGGGKVATIVASDALGGPIEAAIVNAALAQSDETDDNYSAGGAHPGVRGRSGRTCRWGDIRH